MRLLRPAHEKALRATLRVTLFGVLTACGGGSGGGATKTNEPPSNNPTPPAMGKPSPQSEAECRDALKAAWPNGDPKFYDPDEGTPRVATDVSDADLAACCERHQAKLSTDDYRDLGCCSAKWEGGHCTPWGPPMPPAMRA
jgi:hypothetical protein